MSAGVGDAAILNIHTTLGRPLFFLFNFILFYSILFYFILFFRVLQLSNDAGVCSLPVVSKEGYLGPLTDLSGQALRPTTSNRSTTSLLMPCMLHFNLGVRLLFTILVTGHTPTMSQGSVSAQHAQ